MALNVNRILSAGLATGICVIAVVILIPFAGDVADSAEGGTAVLLRLIQWIFIPGLFGAAAILAWKQVLDD